MPLVSVYPKIVSIRTLRNVILGLIRQRDIPTVFHSYSLWCPKSQQLSQLCKHHNITTTNHEYQQYNSKLHNFPRLLVWSLEIGSTSGLWGIPKCRFTSATRSRLVMTSFDVQLDRYQPAIHMSHQHALLCAYYIHTMVYRRYIIGWCLDYVSQTSCHRNGSCINNGAKGNELFCTRRTRQQRDLHCSGIHHYCWSHCCGGVQL